MGFALGKDGYTVTDTETIEIKHNPEYSLAFEKSYYILAQEGLFMDIKKKQDQCPNSQSTVRDLNEDDWGRLSCKLLTIKREFISDL